MSNSSLVTVNVPADAGNYTVGRSGRKIEMIAIHHMAGVLSAKECGNIFATVGRGASSHYGIGKDGEVAQFVDEANTAWCNSNWDSNCKSVTIEASNSSTGGDWTVSDTVLNKLIELVADIAKRNNLGTLKKGENVVWHSMYTATTCPGDYLLSKMDYIVEQANKINNSENSTSTTTTAVKTNEEIADEVIAGKWGNGDDRKTKLTNAGYDYSAIQKIVNQKLSGSSTTKKVNTQKGLNMRKSASKSASVVTAVPYGKTVTVTQENVATADGYNWDKCTYGSYSGYMANKYLS